MRCCLAVRKEGFWKPAIEDAATMEMSWDFLVSLNYKDRARKLCVVA